MSETTQDVWAIVELMGHKRFAGRLTEEEKFGSKLGRLDVPIGDGFFTKYFGGASVYAISIVEETVARSVAKHLTEPVPVSAWELPKQIAAKQQTPICQICDQDVLPGEPHTECDSELPQF